MTVRDDLVRRLRLEAQRRAKETRKTYSAYLEWEAADHIEQLMAKDNEPISEEGKQRLVRAAIKSLEPVVRESEGEIVEPIQAHSKSEYRRLTAQGAKALPPPVKP